MENREGQGCVQNNTGQTWHNTRVEAHKTAGGVNLPCVVHEATSCTLSLHLGLDHINWVVRHSGAETGKATSEQINDNFVLDEAGQFLLGVSENDKAHSLVGRLLHDGWDDTLVETSETSLLGNSVDTLEDVGVLWIW